MTREEAKSCIGTIEMLQRLAYNIHGVMDVIDGDNCKKIIKALEQEPVLDKIRAEIVELTKCSYGTECLGANCPSNTDCMICGDHVLEILDKYKADSEEINGR